MGERIRTRIKRFEKYLDKEEERMKQVIAGAHHMWGDGAMAPYREMLGRIEVGRDLLRWLQSAEKDVDESIVKEKVVEHVGLKRGVKIG